jgi:hypothetical protein
MKKGVPLFRTRNQSGFVVVRESSGMIFIYSKKKDIWTGNNSVVISSSKIP